MFMSNDEKTFLLSYIDNTKNMLEYGSGNSTLLLENLTKTLVSVEHDLQWYNYVSNNIKHAKLIYHPPNNYNPPSDGTYEEFREYIESPLPYAPFDIILIDGRARYSCANFAYKYLSHKDTLFFIHDFYLDTDRLKFEYREEYIKVLEFLNIINYKDTLFLFKKHK